MASNKQVEELDFNALVVRCAGPDKEEQEAYLVKVVMKLLIQHFGRGKKLPDENVLRAIGICEKDTQVAMKVLDSIYEYVVKALLGDHRSDLLGISPEIIEYMRSDCRQKEEYRRKRAEQTFLDYPEECYGLDEDPVTDELMFLEIMEDDEC